MRRRGAPRAATSSMREWPRSTTDALEFGGDGGIAILCPGRDSNPHPLIGERILSPPRLPFRHLGRVEGHVQGAEAAPNAACSALGWLEATGGFEPPNRAFAELRLNHLATSPRTILPRLWCRGGDLNSYGFAPTAPSRPRVYQFHHLGTAPAWVWQEWEDSNPRPAVLETAALAN